MLYTIAKLYFKLIADTTKRMLSMVNVSGDSDLKHRYYYLLYALSSCFIRFSDLQFIRTRSNPYLISFVARAFATSNSKNHLLS